MSPRQWWWTLFAVGHLGIVLFGAANSLPDRTEKPGARLLRWYATMSGADWTFGFFAPNVGSRHRAKFLLHDNDGSTWSDTFDQTTNSEAGLRLNGIVESAFISGAAQQNPEWRKRLVASWAAAMFTRHPRAISLTVVVEAYDVPTMAEYRAGARPNWVVVYRSEVRRQVAGPHGRSEE